MGGFFILYDVENDISIRATKKDIVEKVMEVNPKLKPIMSVSGWQCSTNNFNGSNSMTAVSYLAWVKKNLLEESKKQVYGVPSICIGQKVWYNEIDTRWVGTIIGIDCSIITLKENLSNKIIKVHLEEVYHTDPTGKFNLYPGQKVYYKEKLLTVIDVVNFDPLIFRLVDLGTDKGYTLNASSLAAERDGKSAN